MLVELLEEKQGFTNSEKQIADYILKRPFDIKNMTAEQLGEVTFTSKSSVFRLCSKLDVESFQELKRQVEWEMAEKSRLDAMLEKEPFDQHSSMKEIVNLIPSFYDSALSHTKLQLDYVVLQRVMKRLRDAEKVDIYGTGITYSCAMTAQFKFLSIGKDCTVYNAINEHYEVANKKRKKVAIVLSFTGRNPGIIRIVQFLRQQNVYILGIGGGGKEDLRSLCSDYLDLYQKELVSGMEMMTPYISMTYLFDVLFAALLVSNFDRHMEDAMEVQRISDLSKIRETGSSEKI